MESKCCVECFADEELREVVRETSKETGTGACNYCRRRCIAVVGVGTLYDSFKSMMTLYVPSDDQHGGYLIDLIQGEYEVFAEKLYESGEADRLLDDIMAWGWDDDDGEPQVGARDLYHWRSSQWFHTTMAEAWDEFCEKMRADPAHEPDFPPLFDEDIARLEVDLPQGTALHRARMGFVDGPGRAPQPYEGSEMGTPPAGKAIPGRANARGEVVLYVADQEATAVAEVRPSRGLLVSVAELEVVRDLRVIDLSRWTRVSYPFTARADARNPRRKRSRILTLSRASLPRGSYHVLGPACGLLANENGSHDPSE